jgi:hypothetical protein
MAHQDHDDHDLIIMTIIASGLLVPEMRVCAGPLFSLTRHPGILCRSRQTTDVFLLLLLLL